jgi:hypothetical protein
MSLRTTQQADPVSSNPKEFPMSFRNASRFLVASTFALAGSAVAQTSVTFVNGQLTLTTPGTDQNVKVEMKGAEGVANLFGFPGIADGTAYSGVTGVAIITGAGRDEVQFDIEQSRSLNLSSNTGTGDALTKAQWKIRPGSTQTNANLTLASAPGGLQLAEIGFDSETLTNAAININTGNAGEVVTKVNADDPSARLDVTFNSRGSKSLLEILSAASTLNVRASGTHSGALNEINHSIAQIRPGSVNVATNVTLGANADKFEGKVSAPGSTAVYTGTINGGGGDDFINIETDSTSSVNGQTVSGGAGNDFIQINSKGVFQLSQTLGTRLLGGDGNDFLILFTDSAIRGTGLPNDVEPIINGGVGFDLYNAFGLILNCEGRL